MEDHDPRGCRKLFDDCSSYIDGELVPERCEELARHFEACEACRRYLLSLRTTRDLLNRLGKSPSLAEEEADGLLRECFEAFRNRLEPSETG